MVEMRWLHVSWGRTRVYYIDIALVHSRVLFSWRYKTWIQNDSYMLTACSPHLCTYMMQLTAYLQWEEKLYVSTFCWHLISMNIKNCYIVYFVLYKSHSATNPTISRGVKFQWQILGILFMLMVTLYSQYVGFWR